MVYSKEKAEPPAQSEGKPDGNPITGTVITLIPFTMTAVLAAALVKRRKK